MFQQNLLRSNSNLIIFYEHGVRTNYTMKFDINKLNIIVFLCNKIDSDKDLVIW